MKQAVYKKEGEVPVEEILLHTERMLKNEKKKNHSDTSLLGMIKNWLHSIQHLLHFR